MSGTIGDARKREAEASTSTEPFDSNDAITIAKYGTPVAQDAASAPETARLDDSIPKMAPNTNDVISGRPLGDDEREALRFYASGECNQFDAKRILRLLDALEAAEQRLANANARISTQESELRKRRDANDWANPAKATVEPFPKDAQQAFIRFCEQRERAEKAEAERDELCAKVERVEALATQWVVEARLSGSEPLGVAVRLCHKELRDALRGDS